MITSSRNNDLLRLIPSGSEINSRIPSDIPSIVDPAHPTHHVFLKQALCFDESLENGSQTNVEKTNKKKSGKPFSSLFEKALMSKLGKIQDGQIEIRKPGGSVLLGKPQTDRSAFQIKKLVVEIHDQRFFKRTVLGGAIGAAESYMDGDWSCNDLTGLIKLMVTNLDQVNKIDQSTGLVRYMKDLLFHKLRFNSVKNSKKNIQHHYDVGNDFYQLFLDPTLNYSAGVFPTRNSSMEEASIQKMDLLCQKLRLTPSDHVVEIGTGWGALAAHMAGNYGCKVTTTTISQEQFRYAKNRIEKLGLEDRVNLLLLDYRDLPKHCGQGVFDKLVSVEMIEAVGHQYYDSFFSVCNQLVKADGQMLLQAITIGDQDYKEHISGVDFISRYIFPGGSLPSVGAICESVGKKTQFRPVHLEDLTPHYEKTLVKWRDKFFANLTSIKQLDYSPRFLRMWHYYLCYCEAAFAAKRVHSVHALFSKPNNDF